MTKRGSCLGRFGDVVVSSSLFREAVFFVFYSLASINKGGQQRRQPLPCWNCVDVVETVVTLPTSLSLFLSLSDRVHFSGPSNKTPATIGEM